MSEREYLMDLSLTLKLLFVRQLLEVEPEPCLMRLLIENFAFKWEHSGHSYRFLLFLIFLHHRLPARCALEQLAKPVGGLHLDEGVTAKAASSYFQFTASPSTFRCSFSYREF